LCGCVTWYCSTK